MKRLTAFLFGFVIAVCAGLAMLPKAHGAQPTVRGVLAMVLAIDANGAIVGAQLIGIPKDMAECNEITKQVQAKLPNLPLMNGAQRILTACVEMRTDNGVST